MATAADVPGKYDLVLNGEGYMFAEQADNRASYGFSPTFVQRQNVSGNYGDNEQDFYLMATQKDWSLGLGQKYFRSGDADSVRKYWGGTGDPSVPGQYAPRRAETSVSALSGLAILTACPAGSALSSAYACATATKLYSVTSAGVGTDLGTHGLGAAPGRYGSCTDGTNVYLSTETAGTVGVRKYNGSVYSTFSATAATCVEFLNNTLYGIRASDMKLNSYDTAGAATLLFQWKDAAGTAATYTPVKLKAFGGKLLVLLQEPSGASLWQYDGTGVSVLARMPGNFIAYDIEVVNGVACIGGILTKGSSGTTYYGVTPIVYSYTAGGVLDVLWTPSYDRSSVQSFTITDLRNNDYSPALTAYDGKLFIAISGQWNAIGSSGFFAYDFSTGAVTQMTTQQNGAGPVASCQSGVIGGTGTGATVFPANTLDSTTLYTSQFDFDSSLDKYIKSVIIDFDGSGTLGVSYYLNGAVTSPTSLGSATSGVELTVGQTARSIMFSLTIASTLTVKRIRVRAAPLVPAFYRRNYVLNLAGRDGAGHAELRDGSLHPKDGLTQAQDLNTASASTTPISITDRFGTFTGVIEPDGFELREFRPEEFVAFVRVRQV